MYFEIASRNLRILFQILKILTNNRKNFLKEVLQLNEKNKKKNRKLEKKKNVALYFDTL